MPQTSVSRPPAAVIAISAFLLAASLDDAGSTDRPFVGDDPLWGGDPIISPPRLTEDDPPQLVFEVEIPTSEAEMGAEIQWSRSGENTSFATLAGSKFERVIDPVFDLVTAMATSGEERRILRKSIPITDLPCGVPLEFAVVTLYRGKSLDQWGEPWGNPCTIATDFIIPCPTTSTLPETADIIDIAPNSLTVIDGRADCTFSTTGEGIANRLQPLIALRSSNAKSIPVSLEPPVWSHELSLDARILSTVSSTGSIDLRFHQPGENTGDETFTWTLSYPTASGTTYISNNTATPAGTDFFNGTFPNETYPQQDPTPPAFLAVETATTPLNIPQNFGPFYSREVTITVVGAVDPESGIGNVTGTLVPEWDDESQAHPGFPELSPDSADSTSGGQLGDDYGITFRISPGSSTGPPPNRYILQLAITNGAGETTFVERAAEIQVRESSVSYIDNIDRAAPELGTIEATAQPVDIDAGSVPLVTVISARDRNPSGIASVQLIYTSPSGVDSVYASASPAFGQTGGDSITGTFSAPLSFPPHAEAGTWRLRSAQVRDKWGNTRIYDPYLEGLSATDPIIVYNRIPKSWPTTIEVINSAGDGDRPYLIDFQLGALTGDTSSAPVEVPVTVVAGDASLGVSSIDVSTTSVDGLPGPSLTLTGADLTAGDANSGTYQGTITFPAGQPSAIYAFTVSLRDPAFHYRSYGTPIPSTFTPDLPMPAGAHAGIEITGTPAAAGNLPPTVTAWSLSETSVELDGTDTTITFTLDAGDPDTDLSAGGFFGPSAIILTSPGGSTIRESFTPADRIAGDGQAGTYVVPVTVSRYAEPGRWRIHIEALDDTFLSRSFGARFGNLPSGSPASLTVSNTGTVDTEPPFPVQASLSPAVLPSGQDATATLDFRFTDDGAGFSSAKWTLYRSGRHTTFSTTPVIASGTVLGSNRITGDEFDGTYQVTVPISAADATPGFITLVVETRDQTGFNPLHTFTRYDSATHSFSPTTLGGHYPFPNDPARILVLDDDAYATWAQTAYPPATPPAKRHPSIDLDRDGENGTAEFNADTDPADPGSKLGLALSNIDTGLTISPYHPGTTYTLQRLDPSTGQFIDVPTAILSVGDGSATLTDPTPPMANPTLYRVILNR